METVSASTQQYLRIAQIRDNTVVLISGDLRQIIEVSSLNFSLKSSQEQNAIIASYQSFLNSLIFPIQAIIHSRRLDLAPYLAKLNERLEQEQNALIRIQTADYIDFIKRLLTVANIMDKKFYLIVPYSAALVSAPGGIFGLRRKGHLTLSAEKFQKFKQELDERTKVVATSLSGIGLRAEILNTQQLIELYYSTYNEEEAPREHIASKPDELLSAFVAGGPPQPPPIPQNPAPTPAPNPPAGGFVSPSANQGGPIQMG